MTDKEILTTIKAKVEKLNSQLLRGACSSQIAMETMCKEEAYNEVLAILDTMQDEPVSDELEEAADNALSNVLNTHEIVNVRSCLEMFRLGAKWQKQKDNNNANHALVEQIKTQQMCYEKGIADMRQQMMAKAIDGDITFDYYGDDDKTYGCIAHDSFCLEDFGLKDRDKVKMILIKEDKL